MRIERKTNEATTITWQPNDGTRYEFVVLHHPHGGLVLWWTNGRSSRKGQDPLISSWWPRDSTFRDLSRIMKGSMKLVPYDAEALAVGMAEAGYSQPPRPGDLKLFREATS